MDTTVPHYTRFKWPKTVPPLDDEQLRISNDFMHHWHEVLPQRYGALEQFNHGYPLRFLPATSSKYRTLEPHSSTNLLPGSFCQTARGLGAVISWKRSLTTRN
jgi:hypothetical protein